MQFISPGNQGQALGPKQASQSPGLTPANQLNQQQMLAQALRGQQQDQPTEEEMMMIQQLMERGMNQSEATTHVMQMRGRTANTYA